LAYAVMQGVTVWGRRPDAEVTQLACLMAAVACFLNLQLKRAWDAWQAGRWQGGEISQRPGYTNHAFRLRNDHSCHRNTSSRNWTL